MDRRRTRIYWTCQLAGWLSAAALYLFYMLYGGTELEPWQPVIGYASSAVVAIACTHAYRSWLRHRSWRALSPVRLLPRALVASLLVGAAITLVTAPLWLGFFGDAWWASAPYALFGWSSTVLVWTSVYFGVHYFERGRQLEVEQLQLAVVAAEARLHGLVSQLNPHFLFNCLNSVRALIIEDPEKAQTAVTALSSLMRYSLHAGRAPTVSLASELEIIATYLELEAIRLDERLHVDVELAPDTRALEVPAMLVQSLVENGVKHGVESVSAGGTIGVRSWLDAGALCIRVTNPGQLDGRKPCRDGAGVGLANARERLRLLYGEGATLTLRNDGASAVAADVRIPQARRP